MDKIRKSVTLDNPLVEYVEQTVDNFSGFVNGVLWEALGDDPMDGPEVETVRVRERVLRMHKEVLDKEIAELQRQRDDIEAALDEAEGDPSVLWEVRLDRIIHDRHAARPKHNGGDDGEEG